jgi:hypothetical protein
VKDSVVFTSTVPTPGRLFMSLVVVIGLVMTSAAPSSAATNVVTGPLTVGITSPAYYQQEPLGPLQASGIAGSNVAVTKVEIKVISGLKGAHLASGLATLVPIDATHVLWSWTWTTPSPGSFTLQADATDQNRVVARTDAIFDVASASGQAFLTLLSGRNAYSAVGAHCQALPNTVPITQVADMLHQLGISGVGAVITGWTKEVTRACKGSALYPSWADLAAMRDRDGWSFVSEGPDHTQVTRLTPAQQYAAACGSLLPLTAHGHTRSWGLFAYPGNIVSVTMQKTITDRCYAYGRTYQLLRNHRQDLGTPYLQNSINIDGGACNDSTLPCSTPRGHPYFPVDQLKQLMQSGPGEWTVLQTYKFVTAKNGKITGAPLAWDCTSPDWHQHWTNSREIYCLDDFLSAARSIPTSVTVTDPAGVAAAWNQMPAIAHTTITSVDTQSVIRPPSLSTTTTTAGNDATFNFVSDNPRSWFTCRVDQGTAALCDTGFTVTGLTPGPHRFDVVTTDSFGRSGAPASWTWTAA